MAKVASDRGRIGVIDLHYSNGNATHLSDRVGFNVLLAASNLPACMMTVAFSNVD